MTRTRSEYRTIFRIGSALVSGLLLTLLAGCKFTDVITQAFSLSGPQSTIHVAGPVAQNQYDIFMVTVWVTSGIFIVVGAVLAYATIKFKVPDNHSTNVPPPEQGHGNPFVELGLIIASVALLVIISIPTLKGIWYTHDVPEAEKANAMDITATGYQWWFKFEYNSEVVKLPAGGEAPLSTSNELVVPAGVPIRVHLRTIDVIHSFWLPKLAGKVDMIPNRPNFLWFKADKPGYYYGQCAEYCGESHAIMRFRVIALSAADYVKWLDNQKNPARTVTAETAAADASRPRGEFASLKATGPGSTLAGSPEFDADPFAGWKNHQQTSSGENVALITEGRRLFKEKSCVNCHTTMGHDGGGIVGPNLTHVGARSTIAAGVLENTPTRMHQWIKAPNDFKPGNKMHYGFGGMAGYVKPNEKGELVPNILLNDHEIDALVAYLQSLK